MYAIATLYIQEHAPCVVGLGRGGSRGGGGGAGGDQPLQVGHVGGGEAGLRVGVGVHKGTCGQGRVQSKVRWALDALSAFPSTTRKTATTLRLTRRAE